jgi:hypothetical protein
MSDIVERLRDPGVFVDRNEVANVIENQAGEIIRLQIEVKRWQQIAGQGVVIERELRTEIERLQRVKQ